MVVHSTRRTAHDARLRLGHTVVLVVPVALVEVQGVQQVPKLHRQVQLQVAVEPVEMGRQ